MVRYFKGWMDQLLDGRARESVVHATDAAVVFPRPQRKRKPRAKICVTNLFFGSFDCRSRSPSIHCVLTGSSFRWNAMALSRSHEL